MHPTSGPIAKHERFMENSKAGKKHAYYIASIAAEEQ